MKRIGIIKKISKKIPQYSYITIYKLFVRPHFGYGDVIYDLTNNERFSQKKLKNVIPCYSCKMTRAVKITSQNIYTTNKVLNLLNLKAILGNHIPFIKNN